MSAGRLPARLLWRHTPPEGGPPHTAGDAGARRRHSADVPQAATRCSLVGEAGASLGQRDSGGLVSPVRPHSGGYRAGGDLRPREHRHRTVRDVDLRASRRHSGVRIARHRACRELQVAEGAFEIPHRLSLPLADSIQLSNPVRAISQDLEGVTVEADTGTVRCRRAIVCVPGVLARKSDSIHRCRTQPRRSSPTRLMGACIKFHALYDRPFWRSTGLNGTILSATTP